MNDIEIKPYTMIAAVMPKTTSVLEKTYDIGGYIGYMWSRDLIVNGHHLFIYNPIGRNMSVDVWMKVK